MVGVKIRQSGSWLDPRCNGLMGWKLGKRLCARVSGHAGLFLTLTYRRDEYDDAKDLYLRQSERQDVPLFMRKLGRRLGRSLKGKWLAKLEFQRGGWVHWHIVLLDVEFIPHDVAASAWGRGFVKVKALTKKRAMYTCKYVSKDGGKLPAWLYLERPRSVKIVRVSSGFWEEPVKRAKPPGRDVTLWADGTEVGKQRLSGCYVPIGVRLEQSRGVVVRVVDGEQKQTYGVACDPAVFLVELAARSAGLLGQRAGWIIYFASRRVLEEVVAAVAGPRSRSVERSDGEPPPPRSGALNLRGTSNPDAVDVQAMQDAKAMQQVLEDVWREDAEQAAYPWLYERLQERSVA